MDKFGKSGNANPAYASDWDTVKLEGNNELEQDETFNSLQGECMFPSTHEVTIFYQKIGTVEEP